MNPHRIHLLAARSVSVGLLVAAQAYAAPTKVNQSDWWGGVTGLPSYVNMYVYVPKNIAASPPIVVVPHHCGGDGSSSYSENSGLVTLSDSVGFVMIFPEATGQNCWDAGSTRSMNHSGKGDVPAIVQMVKYALAKYNGDPNRIYSVGGSSGGIMTEALLGVFPDVFTAGVSVMGVPCGCWAQDYHDVTGKPSDGTGQWSGPCAGGNVDKTGKQWGDLVRSYFPGYTGHRPRLQHWHGTNDTTINYKNMAQDIKEWTNLLELSETPSGSDTPKSGTTRQYWKNSCGYTVYETFAVSGAAHSLSIDATGVATYFGINSKTTTVDPEAAVCPWGGSSSTGGAASTGGTTSAGSTTTGGGGSSAVASGGRSNASGGAGAGGQSSSSQGTGGAQSAGGREASGGANPSSATGGRVSTGGAGSSATGGRAAAGGASASGGQNNTGSKATGGSSQTSGDSSTGGNAHSTSTTSSGTPDTGNTGGASSAGNSSSVTSTSAASPDSDSGCGCVVAGRSKGAARTSAALLLAMLGFALRRRQR